MTSVETICALLLEKRESCALFERETRKMLVCDAQQLGECVARRQDLIGQMDRADEQIQALCAADPQAQALRSAILNRCDRQALSDPLGRVFDTAQPLFAILNRLRALEPQALERVALEREQILQSIRRHNQGVEAQAARFSGASAPDPSARLLLGSRYQKV